jgi:hypothetical protein
MTAPSKGASQGAPQFFPLPDKPILQIVKSIFLAMLSLTVAFLNLD